MLAKEMIITQFDYNTWANGRILQKATLVTDDQLNQPIDFLFFVGAD